MPNKKRPREDSEEAPKLVESASQPTEQLTKSQKRKLKKQKLAEATQKQTTPTSEKKVQFSNDLEKGPTPPSAKPSEPPKPAMLTSKSGSGKVAKREKISLASGVTIEDHTIGTGSKAKNGSKLGIRYVGKLAKGGKVFDKNTKGTPFRFVLGKGEVIKGTWIFLR